MERVRNLNYRVFCVMIGLAFSAHAQTQAQVAGYVFGLAGEWGIAPQYVPKMVLGQVVHSGEVIRLKPGVPAVGFINIGLLDGSLLALNCAKPGECQTGSLSVPAMNSAPSLAERTRALYSHFFEHGAPPVVFTMSRGDAAANSPSEAVLALSGKRVDFGPALGEAMASGEYEMRVRRLPLRTGDIALRTNCQWRPPDRACSSEADLTPGLHRLEVFRGGRQVGSAAVILIVVSDEYSQVAQTFRDLKQLTNGWQPRAQPESIHYFLTVALDALASTLKAKP